MSPMLDIQQRFRELGRIRTGTKTTSARGKPIPTKLPRFRLTSPWRHLLEVAAEVYGGTVEGFDHDGLEEFELIVEAQGLDVLVPPGVEVLSQWYERWSGGGCLNRCDGIRQVLVDQPCRCPKDPVERALAAAKNPPDACKPTSRLRVMLPAIPDLGIWRLETHGYHAAAELAGASEFVEMATRRGTLVPARLVLHKREGSRRPNEPRKVFYVPALAFRERLGDTLEAMGYLEAGSTTPVHLPSSVETRPDLRTGGAPALPAGSVGFDPATAVESAELPGEPELPEPVIEGEVVDVPAPAPEPSAEPIAEPEPAEKPDELPEPEVYDPPAWEGEDAGEPGGERTYSGPQLIAIKLQGLGVTDRARKLAIVGELVGRPLESTKDLGTKELEDVLAWLNVATEEDLEELVGPVEVDAGATVTHAQEVEKSDLHQGEEWPPRTADGWRDLCRANGVKVTDLREPLTELAGKYGIEVPRKLDAIADTPDGFAQALAAYIAELGKTKEDPNV